MNIVDNNEKTALMWASSHGHAKIAKLLISEGADVNAVDSFGSNALMKAIRQGHIQIVELLIANVLMSMPQ